MISKAIVQSAIVLMNRRMKVERGVITFDSVRSSVEDMHLHHLGGTNQAQAQTCHVLARDGSAADGTRCSSLAVQRARLRLPVLVKAQAAPRTYCGVGD
ncbi:MAG: hypothetical protein DME91_07450 [Verrucomicrobia bacterium]|nr:MAG: hypothetical protein DME91_07450 [Verrucomicrobiota bacterium]